MSRESITASLTAPEEGWTPIEPLVSVGTGRSFVSGDPEGDRLRVRYFRRARDGALVGRVWFGPGAEGPPGHAHGGSMAAVLDEAMGAAAWMAGHTVVAARVTINLRSMLSLESEVLLEAWVDRVEWSEAHHAQPARRSRRWLLRRRRGPLRRTRCRAVRRVRRSRPRRRSARRLAPTATRRGER